MALLADLINAAIPVRQAKVIAANNGWITVDEIWAYASATTITVPTDATGRFQVGDKLRLDNTTTKYFYVTGVAATVLTVTGGTDYTVANAAITNVFVSRDERPFGFPEYFNYTPTTSASGSMTWSTSISIAYAKFAMKGKTVFVEASISGTTAGSASTELRFTLPITAASSIHGMGSVRVYDGAAVSGWMYFVSTTVAAVLGYASGNWGIGAGRGFIANFFYEAA